MVPPGARRPAGVRAVTMTRPISRLGIGPLWQRRTGESRVPAIRGRSAWADDIPRRRRDGPAGGALLLPVRPGFAALDAAAGCLSRPYLAPRLRPGDGRERGEPDLPTSTARTPGVGPPGVLFRAVHL